VLDYNEEFGCFTMRLAINLAVVFLPQGLLHAGLIKAPGVGYTMVSERIQLGVLD
jgi:hypothetical protein